MTAAVSKLAVIPGQQFGRLTVQGPGPRIPRAGRLGEVTAMCACSCGADGVIVRVRHLLAGNTRSCGCLSSELTAQRTAQEPRRRGYRKPAPYGRRNPLYRTWSDIKRRCHSPASKAYYAYGALGVSMHEPWREDSAAFIKWIEDNLGPRPAGTHPSGQPLYTLDRWPDSDGNYEPGNLRWATASQQRLNRRSAARP